MQKLRNLLRNSCFHETEAIEIDCILKTEIELKDQVRKVNSEKICSIKTGQI